MPRQSQDAYWSCDHCMMGGFRSFEEAKSHEVECQQQPRKRQRQDYGGGGRCFMLMEPLQQHNLSGSTAAACQSLQVFEAPEAAVGIRCAHCAPHGPPVFPGSVDTMASSVNMMASQNLRGCAMVPNHVKEALASAAAPSDEQQLREYCHAFCRRYGIVDRLPTGLVFEDTRPAIAATPLARRSKEPQRQPFEETPYTAASASAGTPYQQPAFGSLGMYGAAQEQASNAAAFFSATQATPQEDATPYGGMHQPSPYEVQQQQQQQQPPPPNNSYPFFQDHNGSWVCRYCSSLHPQYREPGSIWSTPHHTPPPGHFIDHHLSMCRAYSQSMQQHPPMPPPPGWGAPYPPSYGGMAPYPPQQQAGGWTTPGMVASTPGGGGYPGAGGPTPEQQGFYPSDAAGMMPADAAMEQRMAPPPTTPRAPATPSDASMRAAIDHLVTSIQKFPPEEEQLVLDEDKLLLTDYFYYLMKQLRLCRFSEADRKTRGGKRENIKVGYGGLQCVHCSEAPNSRKFFWSNVDRLANSFAEIPGHILKCRRCPNQTKTALAELKLRHPEQMSRLPRGSQKVFFRRMWRRLHPQTEEEAKPPAAAQQVPSPEESKASTSSGSKVTTGSSPRTSDDSSILVQRTTEDSAKALAASVTAPPSPSSRILLAIAEDTEWLSDMDCFIRRNLEVFCATEDDVALAQSDRKYPVSLGQVGIRCIHCALAKVEEGARGNAVAYPYSISGIYESVREFQRLHLESCPNLPKGVKTKLIGFKGSASLSSVLRKYYVLASKALGMYDTPDGIRSGAESVPLGSSAAFAFSETTSSRVSEQMRMGTATAGGTFMEAGGPMITPLESRKRKNPPMSAESEKAIKEETGEEEEV